MPQPFWPKALWAMRALAASRRAARADARPAYPSIFEVLAEHRPARNLVERFDIEPFPDSSAK